jgi:hypothetical protein
MFGETAVGRRPVLAGGIAAVQQLANGLPDELKSPIIDYAISLVNEHHVFLAVVAALNNAIEASLPKGYSQKDYAEQAKLHGALQHCCS